MCAARVKATRTHRPDVTLLGSHDNSFRERVEKYRLPLNLEVFIVRYEFMYKFSFSIRVKLASFLLVPTVTFVFPVFYEAVKCRPCTLGGAKSTSKRLTQV